MLPPTSRAKRRRRRLAAGLLRAACRKVKGLASLTARRRSLSGCRTAQLGMPSWAVDGIVDDGARSPERTRLRGGGVAHRLRDGQRLVGAGQKLDRHENQLLVANVLQIVHLVLARAVGLVARFARLVAVFDGGAVHQMLATAPA